MQLCCLTYFLTVTRISKWNYVCYNVMICIFLPCRLFFLLKTVYQQKHFVHIFAVIVFNVPLFSSYIWNEPLDFSLLPEFSLSWLIFMIFEQSSLQLSLYINTETRRISLRDHKRQNSDILGIVHVL